MFKKVIGNWLSNMLHGSPTWSDVTHKSSTEKKINFELIVAESRAPLSNGTGEIAMKIKMIMEVFRIMETRIEITHFVENGEKVCRGRLLVATPLKEGN